ncbi:hypothetical protein JMF97_30980, partial [Micromonospora fiedleri]|nr:hypothetical protein [Micromonospora fiedleri]
LLAAVLLALPGRPRRVVAVLAVVLVLAAFTLPNQPWRMQAGAFLRIPLEARLLAAVLLALPGRPRRVVAVLAVVLVLAAFTLPNQPWRMQAGA